MSRQLSLAASPGQRQGFQHSTHTEPSLTWSAHLREVLGPPQVAEARLAALPSLVWEAFSLRSTDARLSLFT